MTPLHITLEILAPIELPKYPIGLDGLLYWAIKNNSDSSDEQTLAYLDQILSKKDGVYQASSMRCIRSPELPLTQLEIAHPTRTHWVDWPFHVIEKKKSVTVKGGPFRKRMTVKDGLTVGYVDFHAVGDAEKIHYCLYSLGFIGTSNNQGFGEIGQIDIQEVEHDYSFFDENDELARVLPAALMEDKKSEYLQIVNSFKPPYHTSPRQLCVIPNFRILTK